MNPTDIFQKLQAISGFDNFVERTHEMTDQWSAEPDSHKAINPIFLFLEEHPNLDVGSPGPLVHFVEDFFGRGYEAKLLDSVRRKPTPHTIWMLNRVINGVKDPEQKRAYIAAMSEAMNHPLANSVTREEASRFLARLKE